MRTVSILMAIVVFITFARLCSRNSKPIGAIHHYPTYSHELDELRKQDSILLEKLKKFDSVYNAE